MKITFKKALLIVAMLGGAGSALAQTVPVIGHVGSLVDPSGTQYATNGYLECQTTCGIPQGTPDVGTSSVLTYADQNHLPGVLYLSNTQTKSPMSVT